MLLSDTFSWVLGIITICVAVATLIFTIISYFITRHRLNKRIEKITEHSKENQ